MNVKTSSQPETVARPASAGQSRTQPVVPTLDAIVESICCDARTQSLKFVLRSDIGHDGE